MTQSAGVDRSHQKSTMQKLAFAGLHFCILLFAVWLVLPVEKQLFGSWTTLPDLPRAWLLVAFTAVYFLRHLLTLFYLIIRKITWAEALGLVVFLFVIEIGFLLLGGGILRGHPVPFGLLDGVGTGLFLLGSYLNSFSEIQRKWWKQDRANKGHCYTGGLFRYSMHINYFGDTVLFTGWAMVTHSAIAYLLPLLITLLFIYMHIPGLDAYLEERYGDEFRAYAKSTRKLIPFVY